LRVLLTRSAEDCAAWAEELERRGIASVSLPCISAEPIDSPELRDALTGSTRAADWIVFTSRRGIEAYVRLTAGGREPPIAPPRVAAVGAATAEAAEHALGRLDVVGETGTGESLARTLVAEVRSGDFTNRRVLAVLVLAENAPDTLERALAAAGIDCRRFDVYRTVSAPPHGAKQPLASLGVDAVLLASPSAVRGLRNQVEIDASTPIVTIGPTTSAAARKLGLAVAAEAREPTLDALLEALLAAVPRSGSRRASLPGDATTAVSRRRCNDTENPHA
jgi:uroporphyrinogen-III synthase